MAELAVYVRRASKHYGRGSKKTIVLKNLNMNVIKGTIYGLLGASGCGKTTLLSCLVGRRRLDEGEVNVLGAPPGSDGSCVPGPRVGFMPQEIALASEFTVREVVFYFGQLFGMRNEDLEERLSFLTNLLDLPPPDSFIENMSGGQKRRVSFAVALLSDPELLILDEPTVGLDPVLREAIWNYLMEITSVKQVTVIVTTHYIEEARGAHTIGLLRHGRLLAENTPLDLLAINNCSNLEEAFLKLSMKQGEYDNDDKHDANIISPTPQEEVIDNMLACSKVSSRESKSTSTLKPTSLNRMKALLIKNYKQILRNRGGLAFLLIFPVLQMSLYFGAVGGHPEGLHFAIVNEELGNIKNCSHYKEVHTVGAYARNDICELNGVSCLFVERIKDSLAFKDYYHDKASAMKALTSGKVIGVIHFRRNFSLHLQEREELGRYTSPESIDGSEIGIHLDMSDYQTGHILQKALYDIYYELAVNISNSCNKSGKAANVPIQFNEPIYGDRNPEYVIGLIPGNMIMIVYFLATVLTSTTFIAEKLSGIWDRNLVAGVTSTEVVLSHIISQLTNVFVQCLAVIIVCLIVFSAPCNGSVFLVFLLTYLQGVCGMCFGLLISVITESVTFANYMAVGAFMPAFLLGGIVWPVEGMPMFLKIISLCLPSTMPSISLCSIMVRGWDIQHLPVLIGYVITVSWIVGHCLLCIVILKTKTN